MYLHSISKLRIMGLLTDPSNSDLPKPTRNWSLKMSGQSQNWSFLCKITPSFSKIIEKIVANHLFYCVFLGFTTYKHINHFTALSLSHFYAKQHSVTTQSDDKKSGVFLALIDLQYSKHDILILHHWLHTMCINRKCHVTIIWSPVWCQTGFC